MVVGLGGDQLVDADPGSTDADREQIANANDESAKGKTRIVIDLKRDQGLLAVAVIASGIAIFLVSLGFNLLGDGLRDLLDPKARR